MNNLLVYMSLGGTAAFIVYGVVKVFLGTWLSSKCQFTLLKVCMGFYLIPFPLLSEKIKRILTMLEFDFSERMKETWIHNISKIIYDTPKGYVLPRYAWYIVLLFFIWAVFAIVFFFYHLKNYFQLKKIAWCLSEVSDDIACLAEDIKDELNMSRKIKVYCLEEINAPFCYGFFYPKIVLPEKYGRKEIEIFLKHEMWHIKSCDFEIKMMGLWMITLHFFNPFVYLLFYEIGKVSECACDERVLLGKSKEERVFYGNLLLDTAVSSSFANYRNFFSGNGKKMLKERIKKIKNPIKTKWVVFLLSFGCIFIGGSLSVSGYEVPHIEEEVSAEFAEEIEEYAYINMDEEMGVILLNGENEDYFKESSRFFAEENGEVILKIKDSSVIEKSKCKHEYAKGKLYTHRLNDDGGCYKDIFLAYRCRICGDIKDKELLTYSMCVECDHR